MPKLSKIRLSHYFIGFWVFYSLVTFFLPGQEFSTAALTLFSINSFLFGFYIAPIIGAQKARTEELHKIVRDEANALFGMLIQTKNMPSTLRNELQEYFKKYIHAAYKQRKPTEGEAEYEKIISYCLKYKGKQQDKINKILDMLVSNQANRSQLTMQLRNRIYSHEWSIMLVLFFITLAFILLIKTDGSEVLKIIQAFLATGLTMLLVILIKLSTLTHKKAKRIWDPFSKLLITHYYRID